MVKTLNFQCKEAQVKSLVEELKSHRLLWGCSQKYIYIKRVDSRDRNAMDAVIVEHFHEKLDLVNISEIIWSRNVALVGTFPRSDILVSFKEFHGTETLGKSVMVFSDQLYPATHLSREA